MDVNILEDIGLTNTQAMAYLALIEHGSTTAPALAKRINESRTNTYKLLDKLVELGLASKQDVQKKLHYAAVSPAALEHLVRQQSDLIQQKERRLASELPAMLNFFFAHSERPSIRYFDGPEGLAQITKDQLVTNKPLKLIRSTADANYLSFEGLHNMRNKFPRLGIPREAIIQDYLPYELPEENRMEVEESDKAMLLKRTWIDASDYTEPVEWAVYGDKLSIVQYGEEAMGMVIESAPIANAFRQLFTLLDEGIRRRPDYHLYPKQATYTAIPESLKKKKS